jgi:hypothetical protein
MVRGGTKAEGSASVGGNALRERDKKKKKVGGCVLLQYSHTDNRLRIVEVLQSIHSTTNYDTKP